MGPISHTGPKTSRAARDRPEPNPRRIQPSRHRQSYAGAAAGDGATTTKIAAAAHDAAGNSDARPRAKRRPASFQRRHIARQRPARRVHIQRGGVARPARNIARSCATQPRGRRRLSAAPCATASAALCDVARSSSRHDCATSARPTSNSRP
ncbi:hypothetical protein F511_46222 [Dorcoceras hygrometricum]|uniref:Uncharacterized protein n=1 Tax=Dorcoceras hygrometricum TaxID=472368 RepID=A0A2Z6ZU17_9LAMI|nr:hypothetical protein F511_46222 [Dorcoceras hygrometricum]